MIPEGVQVIGEKAFAETLCRPHSDSGTGSFSSLRAVSLDVDSWARSVRLCRFGPRPACRKKNSIYPAMRAKPRVEDTAFVSDIQIKYAKLYALKTILDSL